MVQLTTSGSIATNVSGLCEGGEIEAEIFNPPLNLNRSTND